MTKGDWESSSCARCLQAVRDSPPCLARHSKALKKGFEMQNAFVFGETAITVNHWYEVGEQDEEHGVRVEVRALQQVPQRETMAASQLIVLDQVIFRADLFDLIGEGESPGNMKRAHFHTIFIGNDPDGRQWSEDLSGQDPFSWLERQLSALEALAKNARLQLSDPAAEAGELRQHLPSILECARRNAGAACRSAAQCLELSRHGRGIVLQQMDEFRPGQRRVDPRVEAARFDGAVRS